MMSRPPDAADSVTLAFGTDAVAVDGRLATTATASTKAVVNSQAGFHTTPPRHGFADRLQPKRFVISCCSNQR